jgi:pyruvate dehydrogenase E2 component (dihydrolipoamide acetyltransferase)
VAKELGVDLQQVQGSGPEGRVQDADVRAFAEARAAAPVDSVPAAPRVTVQPAAAVGELEQLNRVRRVTAERMAQSARSVARVTLFAEADFAEAVRFRSDLKDEFEKRFGAKLTYDAMLVKASAAALREFPALNAQWADGSIRHMPDVSIGVAIAVEQGLLVAVVRNADRKSLAEICKDVEGMAAQARQGKLQVADMSGSTFTITNLGGHGVDAFTPIVNPPEAAILGVGRIAQRPFVVDGRVEPRHTAWLTLAFDHRVTDGAPAGDFLTRIREIVEKPYLLVGI